MSIQRQCGMTLIEMMVANAIFAVLIAVALGFMSTMTDHASVERQSILLEQDANRVLEQMADQLRSAYIRPLESDDLLDTTEVVEAGQITFQTPVDHDEDGDTVTFKLVCKNCGAERSCATCDASLVNPTAGVAGNYTCNGTTPHSSAPAAVCPATGCNETSTELRIATDWGISRLDMFPRDYKSDFGTLRFVKQREFDEAARQWDLNTDGDMVDTFDIGYMEVRYEGIGQHAGQAISEENRVLIQMLAGNTVVRVKDQPVADIDGDGTVDPMFSINRVEVLMEDNQKYVNSMLMLTIFAANPQESTPLMRRASMRIRLRNEALQKPQVEDL